MKSRQSGNQSVCWHNSSKHDVGLLIICMSLNVIVDKICTYVMYVVIVDDNCPLSEIAMPSDSRMQNLKFLSN